MGDSNGSLKSGVSDRDLTLRTVLRDGLVLPYVWIVNDGSQLGVHFVRLPSADGLVKVVAFSSLDRLRDWSAEADAVLLSVPELAVVALDDERYIVDATTSGAIELSGDWLRLVARMIDAEQDGDSPTPL